MGATVVQLSAVSTFARIMESGNITLTIIKPDAVEAGHTGPILAHIAKAGYTIKALRSTHLTTAQAGAFYEVHKERPFYNDLVSYMSSGPVVPVVLEKSNAVTEFRTLIGATDPTKADEGTIRKLFGTSMSANAVHGSDSDENAMREAGFFFAGTELV